MSTPPDPNPVAALDVARSLVRQLAAAVYALLGFALVSALVDLDGWSSFLLQGAIAAFAGWLVARATSGPWWSWAFTAFWVPLLDLAANAGILSMVPDAPSLTALFTALAPSSLALATVTLLGGVAGARRSRGDGRRAGMQADPSGEKRVDSAP